MATKAAPESDYTLRPSCNTLQVDARRNFTARRQGITQTEAIWLSLLSPRLFVMAGFAF
jgi:hypothetical protein